MENFNKNIPIAIVIAAFIIGGSFIYINQGGGTVLSSQAAGEKAINFINKNIQEGATASLVSISEEGSVYKIRLKIGEAEYESYITKDGRFIFPSGLSLEEKATTTTSTAAATSTLDNFAKCLTEKRAKFYGASWCGHCNNQKKMFGDSMQFVNYIECWDDANNKMNAVCEEAKIEGFPTWEFAGGKRQSGEISLEKLSELSGCPLK